MNVRRSGDLQVVNKFANGRNSPVGRADKEANAYLTGALEALIPGVPVLSEEGDPAKNSHIAANERRFWCIDPLDGTNSFIKGRDTFAVNIALIEDGKPVLGAVFFPAQNLLYYTGPDGNSYRSRDGEKPVRIQARGAQKGRTPVLAIGHRDKEEHIERMGVAGLATCQEPLKASNALRICMAAEGSCQLAIGSNYTSTWDTAGPDAVLRAAGGVVVNAHTRQPMTYGKEAIVQGPQGPVDCANPPYFAGHTATMEAFMEEVKGRRLA